MNRRDRRAFRRTPHARRCEAEVWFTDFDGSQASMPCGAVATHELLLLEKVQVWAPTVRRVATKVRACEEHSRDRLDPRYGGEGVIRLRLHPSYLR